MTNFKILSGPDRFTLLTSLMTNNEVEFELQQADERFKPLENAAKTKQPFIINSIGRESGDGNSWLIEGYQGTLRFDGYYRTHQDTESRGWLQIDMLSGKYVPVVSKERVH